MHPVIFRIGNVEFFSYGLMLGLGYVAGVLVSSAVARKRGIDPDSLFWFFILLLAGGIIGGRVAFVALHPWYFEDGLLSAVNVRDGGLSMHGVLAGGVASAFLYARARRASLPLLLDVVAPGVAIGQSIGRIGCFLNGCCYGIPTSGTWGVMTRYAPLLRHPYQLYESAADLVLFLGLMGLSSRLKRQGDLFLTYIAGYSFLRFFLEFFRENELFLFGLSYGQLASVCLFVVSAILLSMKRGRIVSREHDEQSSEDETDGGEPLQSR